MPHATPLITTLAAAFALALGLGFVAVRLKLPQLVGETALARAMATQVLAGMRAVAAPGAAP